MQNRAASFGYYRLVERDIGPADKLTGLDTFVFCRSWETRSLAMFKRIADTPKLVDICFDEPVEADYSDDETKAALERAEKEGRLTRIRLGKSTDVHANCLKLKKDLVGLFDQPRSRVGIDISSFPKVYTLSVMGWCFSDRKLCALRLLYSEGLYEPDGDDKPLTGLEIKLARFTTGPWHLMAVPFLGRSFRAEEGQTLVVLCGSDHDRILSALDTYEHLNRWAVVTAFTPEKPDDVAVLHAESLREEAGLAPGQVYFSEPFSAIHALEVMEKIFDKVEPLNRAGGLILPFSSKPHAVASAIVSLFDPGVTVMARCPSKYEPLPRKASGRGVEIMVADLSSPFAGDLL